MKRAARHIAVVVGLVGLGWIAGRAQRADPDFEIVVNAPVGPTTIECVRGCDLAWVHRGINPNARPIPTFQFECSGATVSHCSSGQVGGWIKR